MAKVNTFFCDCGRTLGRPAVDVMMPDDPPTYNVVHFCARPEDGKLRGLRCGGCGQWWDFIPPTKYPDYADVRKSCAPSTCTTIEHLNGRCQ